MDERAQRFRRLIEPLHDRVLGFARCLCRSTVEGDDLFQEAMLRAFDKLDALREDDAFRAWLYRIVITMHRTRCRRAFWRRLIPLGERDDEGDDDASESAASSGEQDYRATGWMPDAVEANRRARRALAQLPSAQREAIVLFEIEGWRVEEVAALQRVSVSAVKSRLSRGRAHLRELYEAQSALASPHSPTLISRDTP
jgi:RNA polymerase sigma-70 factor (ECF subfamily)